MLDTRPSDGRSSGVAFWPTSDVFLDGEDDLAWGFKDEDSGSLAYEHSVALLKHREHCGNRRSQRRFAVAQVRQDLRWEDGASIIDVITYERKTFLTPEIVKVCRYSQRIVLVFLFAERRSHL